MVKKFYKDIFAFLKSKKGEFSLAAGIFAGSFIAGLVMPELFREWQELIINSIMAQVEGMSFIELTKFIILNNIKASFLAILLSVFFFLFPTLIILTNGFLIGAVSMRAIQGYSVLTLFAKLLPHGIFEIPAILISYTLGTAITLCWIRKNRLKNFSRNLKNSLLVFIAIIIPLLIVAGFIEAGLIVLFG